MLCSFSLQLIFFSEQPFYGNYSTLDSLTNTVISHAFAYSSRWRRKPWQGLYNTRDWSFNINDMIWFGGCSRNTIAIFRCTMMFSELLAGEDQIKHFNHTAKILNLSFYYPRRSVQQQNIFRAPKKDSANQSREGFPTPLWWKTSKFLREKKSNIMSDPEGNS